LCQIGIVALRAICWETGAQQTYTIANVVAFRTSGAATIVIAGKVDTAGSSIATYTVPLETTSAESSAIDAHTVVWYH
jgi:hypothetical protein